MLIRQRTVYTQPEFRLRPYIRRWPEPHPTCAITSRVSNWKHGAQRPPTASATAYTHTASLSTHVAEAPPNPARQVGNMKHPNAWPALTILGITAAITIGLIHATLTRLTDCILGLDDITQP